MFASNVTISNPNSLSSSETRVNTEIRSLKAKKNKNDYLNELDVRKSLLESTSHRS